jgi:hypothetical protein
MQICRSKLQLLSSGLMTSVRGEFGNPSRDLAVGGESPVTRCLYETEELGAIQYGAITWLTKALALTPLLYFVQPRLHLQLTAHYEIQKSSRIPKKTIGHEVDICKVRRNVGKPSTFYRVYSRKPSNFSCDNWRTCMSRNVLLWSYVLTIFCVCGAVSYKVVIEQDDNVNGYYILTLKMLLCKGANGWSRKLHWV